MSTIAEIARQLVAPGQGVLAADASKNTMNKRLATINVDQDEEMRRQYRQLLFMTPDIEQYLSGVILYDGTINQNTDEGIPFVDVLTGKGIIPGIKVDLGTKELWNFPEEVVTEGLDGLDVRLKKYYDLGARFAKWRGVIRIGAGLPSQECIDAHAYTLARYAGLCQEANIVPMIEPEVLMEGNHDIKRCGEVTTQVLRTVFDWLSRYRVDLAGTILKTNMVIAGKESGDESSPAEVAEATIKALTTAVPHSLGGIVFLSGGQKPEQATENLQAISALGEQPWNMTFSYSRALQEPVLEAWGGKPANIAKAQKIFLHRTKLNVAARDGKYLAEMEKEG